MTEILSLRGLNISFKTEQGLLSAVRGINLNLFPGEALGLVGESGSGKSITALSILGLAAENAIIKYSEFIFSGTVGDKIKRGLDIGMIFQDPMSSLDPCFTVQQHFHETLRLRHVQASRADLDRIALSWLNKVGIPDAKRRLNSYPHELSGGMAQRVMIALAVCLQPKLLIADEPTTALDVTIQAQVLKLLRGLQKENNMAMILVSHDLAVIAQNTDRLAVMYLGEIIEHGETKVVLDKPYHPYTKSLLESLPSRAISRGLTELPTIPGTVPSLSERPRGCQSAPRCFAAKAKCHLETPAEEIFQNRGFKCFFPLGQDQEVGAVDA